MSGMIKPSTQRFASRRTRNPAINPNVYIGGGRGGICGGGNKGESLFISSYHEDKKQKYRQQRNDRLKNWIKYVTIGLVAFFVVSSRSGSLNDNGKVEDNQLRSSANPSNANKDSAQPKVSYCTLIDGEKIDPLKEVEKPSVEVLLQNKICGRKIPITLIDHNKRVPPLDPNAPPPAGKEEAILLSKKDLTPSFKTLGDSLNSFFHAYDLSHSTNRPLYMTEDSWPVRLLFPLFFSPASKDEHDTLWSNVENALGIHVVKDKAEVMAGGYKVDEKNDLTELFYVHAGLDPAKMRDHRTAILRKLFLHPSFGGVCDTIHGLLGKDREKKYTVIHVADPGQRGYLSKLNSLTGKDHKAATEMQPDYVKSILTQTDMMKHDIFPIDSSDKLDDVVHSRLGNDNDLKNQLKCLRDKRLEGLGGKIYLAVLADVYLGNPTDHTSMWIARMRYALGMKNTYIFTEKKGDQWVSYMNDEYLELYTSAKLGPWMG